jgi:hypothetical protein
MRRAATQYRDAPYQALMSKIPVAGSADLSGLPRPSMSEDKQPQR